MLGHRLQRRSNIQPTGGKSRIWFVLDIQTAEQLKNVFYPFL